MKILLLFSTFICSLFCNAQENAKNHLLFVTNRSGSAIDSVCVPKINVILKKIGTGETRKITIGNSFIKDSLPDVWALLYYKKGTKKVTVCCERQGTNYRVQTEHFYFYDNGVNRFEDKPPPKPEMFCLYMKDASSGGIDSITVSPATKRLMPPLTENKIFIYWLDYEAFEKNPSFVIHKKKKQFRIRVKHDWQDWNSQLHLLYLYDNGEVSDKAKNKADEVDIDINQ